MVERTDIDALLVGALYGELSAAEEARLTQHLESHPADKVVLEDLTRARTAVRDSRIFSAHLQFEPPQAVSAILLQEAHRRAPKPVRTPEERESWFARFVRVFAAHPAMAAAAMLVLVVGVAGTMYKRHGEDMSASEKAPVATSAGEDQNYKANDTTAAATPSVTTPTVPHSAAAGSGAFRGTDSNDAYSIQLDDGAVRQLAKGDSINGEVQQQHSLETKPAPAPAKVVTTAKPSVNRPAGIEVRRADPQPKDLDHDGDDDAKNKSGELAGDDVVTRPGMGNASGGVTRIPAADPPAQPATTSAPPPPPHAATDKAEKAADKTKDASDASLNQWASQRKSQLVALVQNNDCRGAASVAVEILNRAPDYYHAYVENDRAIKACQAYISEARDRDNEQTGKARAAQKRTVNEAPAPAQTDSK